MNLTIRQRTVLRALCGWTSASPDTIARCIEQGYDDAPVKYRRSIRLSIWLALIQLKEMDLVQSYGPKHNRWTTYQAKQLTIRYVEIESGVTLI